MAEFLSLTTKQQIELFEKRGIIFSDKVMAEKKLEFINYYKLKELSYPYMVGENDDWIYENLSFNNLIKRYYQDKRIRAELIDCTEKIEIALKTLFSHELGQDLGPYGYLSFQKWCNKEKYCRYYIEEKQGEFKERIAEIVANTKKRTKCINQYFKEKKDQEIKTKKIPIWMLVEVLTFGEILYLLNFMSKTRLSKIANKLECDKDELISWLKVTNFIRNQCAHNTSIIDLKLKTKPKMRNEWKKILNCDDGGNPSGRLSDAILPIVTLVIVINNKYTFNRLQGSINRLISDNEFNAKNLGFNNVQSAKNSISMVGGKFQQKQKKDT